MIGPILPRYKFLNCTYRYTYRFSYRAFDTNGDGKIDSTEFKMFLLNFGGNSRKADIDRIFQSSDMEKRRFLNFVEFVAIYNHLLDN